MNIYQQKKKSRGKIDLGLVLEILRGEKQEEVSLFTDEERAAAMTPKLVELLGLVLNLTATTVVPT